MTNPRFQRSDIEFKESVSNWDGVLKFENVFVTKFPDPQKICSVSRGFWNNNTIFVAQAKYDGNLSASISCSTVPPNKSPQEDMNDILNALSLTAKEYEEFSNNELMHIVTGPTPTGDIIIYEIINIAPDGGCGPLIFNLESIYPIENGLKSMCINTIFQRPEAKSRVELSVFYELPPNFITQKEQHHVAQEMRDMLTYMCQQFLEDTVELTNQHLPI